MNILGLLHTGLGLGAMLAGSVVVLGRKGTRRHRLWGRVYFAAMIGLNGTALLIYRLFGQFGIFHWFALVSLATVLAGFILAFGKRPHRRWIPYHAQFMSWSYLGLLMAAASEVTSRIPGLPFHWAVAATSLAVFVAGAAIIRSRLPPAIRSVTRPGGSLTESTH